MNHKLVVIGLILAQDLQIRMSLFGLAIVLFFLFLFWAKKVISAWIAAHSKR